MSDPLSSALPRTHRTRLAGAAKVIVLALTMLAMLPIAPAFAAAYGVVSGFPTVVKSGAEPVQAHAWAINHGSTPVTITEIKFIPSCSVFADNCAGGVTDPGVFTFSPTGIGARTTNCAGRVFNLTLSNPATGEISIRPADGGDVQITVGDIASDLDECKILFTLKANRPPNHDSLPAESYNQTNQLFTMTGVTGGEQFTSSNADLTSVVPVAGRAPANDFDGDGKSDPTMFGESGDWAILGQPTAYWGLKGDYPVPADYNGDRKVDRAVYREGAWHVQGESVVYYGLKGDLPVPSDYDGDGRSDRAVYRNGAWYVHGQPTVHFGLAGDIPVPGDYDGDGDAERAVYRNGAWHVEGMPVTFLGLAGDVPVPGDYDGDKTIDPAVYRGGVWYREGLPVLSFGGIVDLVLNLPQSVYLGFF